MFMEKGSLKLRTEQKGLWIAIFIVGVTASVFMGILSYRNTALDNGYELKREEAGGNAYEETLTAEIDKEKVPVSVTVEARLLTKKEEKEELLKAEKLLDELLRGENERLSCITGDLNFVDTVEGTLVEVEWTETLPEYFYSDGTFREEAEIYEPTECRVSAILSCQESVNDYEAVITLMPRAMNTQTALSQMISKADQSSLECDRLVLPESYQGKTITWRRKPDNTFLYLFAFSIAAMLCLRIGKKKDEENEKKERLEALENDYASVVSKFAMLLSAGLSVRNAWERIVLLGCKNKNETKIVYEEMNRTLKDMQKGVSELEAYEAFGNRVGQVHYKKLMALFVSHKKRGSIDLIDSMNREMLQAWEEQKRKTRQQGEKIGTKLLVPMMGMLAVVFVIILVPAFLSF